jgi:hypothetical protein
MDAQMTATLTAAGCTHTTFVADARASRRARRVVYESCVRSKVASGLADDAMGVAAELVSEMVAQDGGSLLMEVQAGPDGVALFLRDQAGHESSARVSDDVTGSDSVS